MCGDTMSKIEVLSGSDLQDIERWEHLLEEIPRADVYFLPQYAGIYVRKGDGTSHCFVYQSDDGIVLYSFLLRRINDIRIFQDFDECYDITTPYGYGGPIYFSANESSLHRLIKNFLKSFHSYCCDHHIVSEFARLHPLFGNHQVMPNSNKVFHHETVFIDLQQDEDNLWKGIRKGHKSCIKKALRFNVEVIRDQSLNYISEFYNLYIATMKRQQASPFYFFPLSFFQDTLESLRKYSSLFVALHEAKVATASIFLHCGEFIHYHFSGSDSDSLHLCSNHLLIYKVAKWAQQKGIKYFHLGGGLRPEDNLFTFKSGFSEKRSPFYTYRYIHLHDIYQKLVRLKLESLRASSDIVDEEFFPRYRA